MPDDIARIVLAATHGKLSKVKDTLLTEGAINSIKCEFKFRTSDWDNTAKTAVFVRGRANASTPQADHIYVVLDNDNTCDIPAEVLCQNGYFSVGVFGVNGTYRMVSNWMIYRVFDGCYADGSTPSVTTPDVYEQVLIALNNKSNVGHNHDERYYTKSEADDKYLLIEDVPDVPVKSVNGKTGNVVLTAADVGAFANIKQEDGAQAPIIPYSALIDPPDVVTKDELKNVVDETALDSMLKEVLV